MSGTSGQLSFDTDTDTDTQQPPSVPSAAAVPGLRYIADWLAPDAGAALLAGIDAASWSAQLKRRVQHYGHRYDYGRRAVATVAADASQPTAPPLPVWARELAARLVDEGLLDREADQVIVNEYRPGQGISAHVDCVPCFGPVVAAISLGSSCLMDFTDPTTAPSWRCRWRRAACWSWPARPDTPGGMPSPRARATPGRPDGSPVDAGYR
ncbi:alpha-ketoglutarate-dependent dioxygenase AlkB [Streptomyces sp. FXJ1.4098]|nr:alpha-ketoglutarate-dependent dioxygenase AlkB [Streptomyces sp. FXJ1.4098]